MNQLSLRILHHWACSGGTLISKCIASLPGVILLNEIHPLAYLRLVRDPWEAAYAPTDLCRQLSYARNGRDPALIMASFVGGMTALLEKASQEQLQVVIRSHDHIDFFASPLAAEEYILSRLFKEKFRMLQVLTVRHPLDCWLALLNTDWHKQIALHSLDEFCLRCLQMLGASTGMPIIHYERFVLEPGQQLRAITEKLELPFDPKALENFEQITLSGSSGRQSGLIEPRPRQPVSQQLESELLSSKHYALLCNKLSYLESPASDFPHLT
ncbi:MAG: hypothetical protein VKI83_00315 [Synechococcaceae cyanobacterium]|nr:hypothetical protein [Synechococcaceae cyanobacterium]